MHTSWEESYEKLHLGYLLVHLLHELDDEIYQLVFEHLLRMKIRDEKGNIIALSSVNLAHLANMSRCTLIAFLLNIKNASALCVKNLVNLCTNMFSISSACLILMLTRTLLTLGSMRTFSFSFLEIVSGLSRTSGELAASISGTLWRSEVCDAKLERESAAVSDERTHWR